MITQDAAERALLDLAKKRRFKYQEWKGKFKALKLASATEKGDMGEDFLAQLARECGYEVDVVKGRRGQFDVGVKRGGQKLLFEVKVATMDVNGSFQFNGVRYDTKYTHLFCLGISPEKIGFLIVPKQVLGDKGNPMVSMAKGSNASFKLTKREVQLLSFEMFESALNDMMNMNGQ